MENFEVVHHGGLLGHLQKECFGILNKENGHLHIAKGEVGIWTFPTVLYQKKKHNCFKIAMQELKNKEVLVLMWVKCQHLKPNNHRSPPNNHRSLPDHIFN